MPRGGNHPKHPKCPECDKALYKTMEKGKPSRKEDPFCYCRNEACKLYGEVQEEQEREETEETKTEEKNSVTKEPKTGFGSAENSLLSCQFDDTFPSK